MRAEARAAVRLTMVEWVAGGRRRYFRKNERTNGRVAAAATGSS
jgi:hypothetical protein